MALWTSSFMALTPRIMYLCFAIHALKDALSLKFHFRGLVGAGLGLKLGLRLEADHAWPGG
jgi:hypothetical protein